MRLKSYIFFIFCTFFALSISAKQFTIVLDPGHGGKDPGALGKKGQEKVINLNVALKVGNLIQEKYPDVNIVYTRKTDKYVTLQERPNIANKADGDLFISIHTNASESTKAYGAETFTLGLSKSEANFNVAKRENSVLLLEEGNKETYQGFDPTSPESYIMFEFMQSKYIDQSVEIAYYIQKEFVGIKRLDRGVRQAIFWVLHQVKMPSILIELGFITNPSEETFLLSEEGQNKLANCIFAAFEKYKHEYDKRTITTSQTEIKAKDEVKNNEETQKKKKDSKKEKTTKKEKEKKEPHIDSNIEKIDSNIIYKIQVFSSRTLIQENNSDYKKITKHQPVSYFFENGWYKYTCGNTYTYKDAQEKLKELQVLFKDAIIIAFENDIKIPLNIAISKESIPEQNSSETIYKIQVFSSRSEIPKSNSDICKAQKIGIVNYYIENGWYKYTCTETTSYEEAKENLKKIQSLFKDAIIIAFKDGKKISINK